MPQRPIRRSSSSHLYDRALLNRAALLAVGYTRDTPNPPGGEIVRDGAGNPTGLLLAQPNASLLYATLARGPALPPEEQLSSTRHFMRELNRLGVTSVIDAGGGHQNYPDDYAVIEKLHADGELTLRIAYNLFTQKAGSEAEDFERWTSLATPGEGDDTYRLNGAGEMLVFSAADFEDFRVARPELPATMEDDLERVVRMLAEKRWPWRMHATYDETITRALDVFEKVDRDIPLAGLHWFFDHAETVSQENIDRIAELGGGIAIQHRMAFQGEAFVDRYGARAAETAPPISRMLGAGLPVGAGTDATRVASYNPWVSLAWLVTGRTVGGTPLASSLNRIDRAQALRLWTEFNTWFSNEQGRKGRIAVGQLADLAVLSDDYFSVPEDEIAHLSSVLTLLGGEVVHGAGDFADLAPPTPTILPDWSPVRRFGGYQERRLGQPGAARLTRRNAPARAGARSTATTISRPFGAARRPATRRASTGARSVVAAGRSDMATSLDAACYPRLARGGASAPRPSVDEPAAVVHGRLRRHCRVRRAVRAVHRARHRQLRADRRRHRGPWRIGRDREAAGAADVRRHGRHGALAPAAARTPRLVDRDADAGRAAVLPGRLHARGRVRRAVHAWRLAGRRARGPRRRDDDGDPEHGRAQAPSSVELAR